MRYLHGSEVKEDFIEFMNVREEVTKSTKCDDEATFQEPVLTGQNIRNVILEILNRHDLDLKNCV